MRSKSAQRRMSVAIPMIRANAIGMGAFSFIVSNFLHEEKTKEERDRLDDELQKEKAELEMAKEIQQSILPKQLPAWRGHSIAALSRPARQVGGDFYDFFPMEGGGPHCRHSVRIWQRNACGILHGRLPDGYACIGNLHIRCRGAPHQGER
ncbi:MAG TPA: hypothetical protein VLH13_00250 [Methanomassiliicoccales archaeon]|nr:hypothetical protein [Methanomassiliicoccales archaeon]